MDPEAIGHRALASNLSDIAAMGARPVLATVALGIAPGTPEAWTLACYRGMATLARRTATRIVGGDVVRAPAVTISITVVGEVSRSRMKTRAGGKPGDVLAVTGALGASRAGLELTLRAERAREGRNDGDVLVLDASARAAAIAAFASPEPRLREGRYLAASTHVRAMMDLSDGLSTDLARLARASACGANIETIPVHPSASAVARAVGDDAERYALDGGEDFELLLAIRSSAFAHLAARYAAHFGKPLLRIGTLEAASGIRRSSALGAFAIEAGGYDHLRVEAREVDRTRSGRDGLQVGR
jgi:thiamine-monophosphate kinase